MIKSKSKKYYFAYGTNLNIQQMNKRCPRNIILSKNAVLKDYSINDYYKGFLSIKKDIGNIVVGNIYEITEQDLKRLDRFEGYPHVYNRIIKSVLCLDTNLIFKAVIYIDNESL